MNKKIESDITHLENPWRSKYILEYLYNEEFMTQVEIADFLGCCNSTIGNQMEKMGLEVRKGAEAFTREPIEVSEYHHELITGLLMSDGSLMKRNRTPSMQVRMTVPEFLGWLDLEFGNITTGVMFRTTAKEKASEHIKSGFNPKAKPCNYKDIYELNTRCLSDFNKYISWYSSGKKVWPEDIALTPSTLKMFYCGDGNKKNRYQYKNGNPNIRFRCDNESGNKKKIVRMFDRIGFNVTWHGKEVSVPCNESIDMWEYMGNPPPGFEYKWPRDW